MQARAWRVRYLAYKLACFDNGSLLTDQDTEEEQRKFSLAYDVQIEGQRTKRCGFRNG